LFAKGQDTSNKDRDNLLAKGQDTSNKDRDNLLALGQLKLSRMRRMCWGFSKTVETRKPLDFDLNINNLLALSFKGGMSDLFISYLLNILISSSILSSKRMK